MSSLLDTTDAAGRLKRDETRRTAARDPAPRRRLRRDEDVRPGDAAGLTVSAKDGESGMGHRSTIYVLTNATDAPCSLEGFPGMAFLDASGSVLRDTVARGDG
ncbi:MAG TPA: DUF4232 domain-containing protein, partial [Gaiellaceae bacterium]|nr:DUF4232 domain-containing protein [Gaiellaceae bacterium]